MGKALTVYPTDDEHAAILALALIDATKDLAPGPFVRTDFRLGGNIYTRFGSFSPQGRRDRFGNTALIIPVEDGRQIVDSYLVPYESPPGISYPFASMTLERPAPRAALIPGLVFAETLDDSARGERFIALDMRDPRSPGVCVVKSGWHGTWPDRQGRDARFRLRFELEMLETMRGIVSVPQVLAFWEDETCTYLATEALDAPSLEKQLFSHQVDAMQVLQNLCAAVSRIHSRGIVHRDLTPRNVLVHSDLTVTILDFELAANIVDFGHVPFSGGTAGFCPRDRFDDPPPSPTVFDDAFGLAAIAVFVLGGVNPATLHTEDETVFCRRIVSVCRCSGTAASALASVLSCRSRSGGMDQIVQAFETLVDGNPVQSPEVEVAIDERIVQRVANTLVSGLPLDPDAGVWLSSSAERGERNELQLLRSANRGVAGGLYALAHVWEHATDKVGAKKLAERSVDWLLSEIPTRDSGLPGLHFGEAGVAVAVAESVVKGLVPEGAWLPNYLNYALNRAPDWPDFTHGAAGQGSAALTLSRILNPRYRDFAHQHAEYLKRSQRADGSWAWPEGVPAMEGTIYNGFAHGAAGIGYFLADYAVEFGDEDALSASCRAANWLWSISSEKAVGRVGPASWRHHPSGGALWDWWCHGAPGIALFFIMMFDATHEEQYRMRAEAALARITERAFSGNWSLCHGVGGLIDILLYAREKLRSSSYDGLIGNLSNQLILFGNISQDGSSLSWAVETSGVSTADFAVGCGGLAYLLQRVLKPSHHAGFALCTARAD